MQNPENLNNCKIAEDYNAMSLLTKNVMQICNIDADEKIIELLHTMYLASVRNKDLMATEDLENITNLYENLKHFYQISAYKVRRATYRFMS